MRNETGGRAFLNPYTLDAGVANALTESSAYYLLAWRPDDENQRAGKSRLSVTIKGRPDLRVRMRRHFFDFREAANTSAKAAAAATNAPDEDLKAALGSLYPRRDLPTSVSPSFQRSADNLTTLNLSMQIDATTLTFAESSDQSRAVVDVLGIALDDRGQFATFKQKLDIPREVLTKDNGCVRWTQSLRLPAGLYQVRVAVRDRQTARTGSAIAWIEIPSR